MTRIDEIGRKKPIEIFQECLELYGETLQIFNNSSDHEFRIIITELQNQITEKSDDLKLLTVSQVKLTINEMLKRGIPTVDDESFLKITDLISFEPIEPKVERMVEVEGAEKLLEIKYCQKCRDGKPTTHFPTETSKVCTQCISNQNKENSKKSPVVQKSSIKELPKRNKPFNDKNDLDKIDIPNNQDNLPMIEGVGIYQVSIIHKDRITGEMDHSVFEVKSDTKEFAVGTAVLSKEINNDIIIAISYEKIVLHTGNGFEQSK